ncbi:MAG: aspartate kinase [Gammaproteobacteria bacterium]|nr:aspartate kinase [Gammaproteobacteria bacterium]
MPVLVVKFGGTSVSDVTRIRAAANIIANCQKEGFSVVVVVSAMGGDTDRLVDLAQSITCHPARREFDMLLASGEQVSVALLAIALNEKGVKSKSYLADQIQFVTDAQHTRANIVRVEVDKLFQSVAAGEVPVIAGFQGVSTDGEITTIGRGGSDTTAVVIAAAMDAEECRIYTDVDGVYTADPRIVEHATRMERISFEEMLEMAALGAKVLQTQSVEYSRRHSVRLRVLSSFKNGGGTVIDTEENERMTNLPVSAVTYDKNDAKITVRHVPDVPGIAYQLLGPIADSGISVDMIVQNISVDQRTDLTFTVPRENFDVSLKILNSSVPKLCKEYPPDDGKLIEVIGDDTIAKVTVVGLGMRSNVGVASKMFETLAQYGINIQMISTSEIKISVVIHVDFCEVAVRVLHTAFGLDAPKD